MATEKKYSIYIYRCIEIREKKVSIWVLSASSPNFIHHVLVLRSFERLAS